MNQKEWVEELSKSCELWNKILESQVETGHLIFFIKIPLIKNQTNLNIGPVKSSNLCVEIVEVSGITNIQKEILNNKGLLESLGIR
jgi:ribonucleotide reductase alpha subunit